MTGYNTTQNQKIAIISALVLWLAFCGMAAGEQLYVDEDGWQRVDDAFTTADAAIALQIASLQPPARPAMGREPRWQRHIAILPEVGCF